MTDNITLPRATVQQALEALQNCANGEDDVLLTRDALATLRTALGQQAEPVGEVTDTVDGAFKCEFSKHLPVGTKLYTTPPQQQAEPVGEVIDERGEVDYISYVPPVGTVLYTSPQRKPLTDEQLEAMAEKYITNCYFDTLKYARAIEAAHGIKEGT